MPLASEIVCTITEKIWITPTTLKIRFESSKKFKFDAGQFLSVIIPFGGAWTGTITLTQGGSKRLRRIYSFASAPEAAAEEGVYELCIKQTNGPGPKYFESLNVGESFKASAPYGDFVYEPKKERSVCFVSTGTGVAPFRSMVLSKAFIDNPPEKAWSIFGARTQEEIIYPGDFEKNGVQEINALSDEPKDSGWKGYRGRVTDYLKGLPSDWDWHSTDFYICGNGAMVAEVRRLLRFGHNIDEKAIHQEVYFAPAKAEVSEPRSNPKIVVPPPFKKKQR